MCRKLCPGHLGHEDIFSTGPMGVRIVCLCLMILEVGQEICQTTFRKLSRLQNGVLIMKNIYKITTLLYNSRNQTQQRGSQKYIGGSKQKQNSNWNGTYRTGNNETEQINKQT